MSRETRCIDNQQPSFTEVKKAQRLGVMKKSSTSAQYLLQVNFGKENFVPYKFYDYTCKVLINDYLYG